MSARYDRQTMLAEIGPEGQEKLRRASVLIVGVGGLGSVVATYLAAAGVGCLGLADPDTVSLSNLQRQVLYSTPEIGMPKTERAAARLGALNPEVQLRLHPEGFTPGNADELAGQYDLVVDCCDNFATRYLIDDACARAGRTWVYGSIGEFAGQVAVFGPKAGRRYCDLYPEREALCSRPRVTAGVVGPVPGTVGAIQACQAMEILAGFGEPLYGRLFTINLKTLTTNTFNF